VHDLPLATLNVKDVEDFAEHNGLRLINPIVVQPMRGVLR
jgi:hypothetical protein